jgi:hypothetical protein
MSSSDKNDSECLDLSASVSLESSDSLMHELENLFEGASNEERGAADVVAGAIAGGSVSAEESTWGGRRPGSRTIQRGGCSWFVDYLSNTPIYPAHNFRQVFRIPIKLYWVIHARLIESDPRLAQQMGAV